jgi:riboflavin biosynthesis pyrimidine reductase
MTSRQAKHQAKQRADGAVTISVTFRADEPEAAHWAKLVEQEGGPKAAIKFLLKDYVNPLASFLESEQHKILTQMRSES